MIVRWLATMGICAALVLGVTAPAQAQTKSEFDQARKHYLAGKDAQQKGDHEGAVRYYSLAYEITKDPALFKSIAQAYEGAGKRAEAAIYYRRYLNEAKGAPDANEVQAKIAALAGQKDKPKPVAGEPSKLPPPESDSPSLQPLPPLPAAPVLPEGPRAGWQRTVAWVMVGFAAVAATTGAVLATSSRSREEDIQRIVDFREPGTGEPSVYTGSVRMDYEDKDDEGTKLSKYATISFIGAGGFAGAAVLFFILDATRGSEARGARVSPVVGPGRVGVAAGWEF